MRISTGKHKNRKIVSIKGLKIKAFRPTASKVRGAIYNILNNTYLIENSLDNSSVLDVCCGSGILGFEALSQGAKQVTFLDKESSQLAICKHNAELLGEYNKCKFINANLLYLSNSNEAFNIIFIDPPYNNAQLITIALAKLNHGKWIASKNIIIVEHSKYDKLDISEDYKLINTKIYGNTMLTILSCLEK